MWTVWAVSCERVAGFSAGSPTAEPTDLMDCGGLNRYIVDGSLITEVTEIGVYLGGNFEEYSGSYIVINLGKFRRNLLPSFFKAELWRWRWQVSSKCRKRRSVYTTEESIIKMCIAVHKVLVYSFKHKLHLICEVKDESRNVRCYQN